LPKKLAIKPATAKELALATPTPVAFQRVGDRLEAGHVGPRPPDAGCGSKEESPPKAISDERKAEV
jgi:hypothetical protein